MPQINNLVYQLLPDEPSEFPEVQELKLSIFEKYLNSCIPIEEIYADKNHLMCQCVFDRKFWPIITYLHNKGLDFAQCAPGLSTPLIYALQMGPLDLFYDLFQLVNLSNQPLENVLEIFTHFFLSDKLNELSSDPNYCSIINELLSYIQKNWSDEPALLRPILRCDNTNILTTFFNNLASPKKEVLLEKIVQYALDISPSCLETIESFVGKNYPLSQFTDVILNQPWSLLDKYKILNTLFLSQSALYPLFFEAWKNATDDENNNLINYSFKNTSLDFARRILKNTAENDQENFLKELAEGFNAFSIEDLKYLETIIADHDLEIELIQQLKKALKTSESRLVCLQLAHPIFSPAFVVKLIRAFGSETDKKGNTLIIQAIIEKDSLLLEEIIKVNKAFKQGTPCTPVQNSSSECTSSELSTDEDKGDTYDENLMQKNKSGYSPLDYALLEGPPYDSLMILIHEHLIHSTHLINTFSKFPPERFLDFIQHRPQRIIPKKLMAPSIEIGLKRWLEAEEKKWLFLANFDEFLTDLRTELQKTPGEKTQDPLVSTPLAHIYKTRQTLSELEWEFHPKSPSINKLYTFALSIKKDISSKKFLGPIMVDPTHFGIGIEQVEMPEDISSETLNYTHLVKLFDKYVPSIPNQFDHDLQIEFSRNDLLNRLKTLVNYITLNTPYTAVPNNPEDPSIIKNWYEKLAKRYLFLILQEKTQPDPETFFRTALINIALGAPPHCGVRWLYEVDQLILRVLKKPCEKIKIGLKPIQQSPFGEWIFQELHALRVSILYKLMNRIGKKTFEERAAAHEIHTKAKLMWELRPDPNDPNNPYGRGLYLTENGENDPFGPNISREETLRKFDKYYNPTKIIKHLLNTINSFDLKSEEKSLIEDWMVDHLTPRSLLHLTPQDLREIDRAVEQCCNTLEQHKGKTIYPDSSFRVLKKGCVSLNDENRKQLLDAFLDGITSVGLDADQKNLFNLEDLNKILGPLKAFEVFVTSLLKPEIASPLPLFQQLIEQTGAKLEIFTDWFIRSSLQSTDLNSMERGRLKQKLTQWLKLDSSLRQALLKLLFQNSHKELLNRLNQLETGGKLHEIATKNNIPIGIETLENWAHLPWDRLKNLELLKMHFEHAVLIKKRGEAKMHFYETYPAESEEKPSLVQYDSNALVVPPSLSQALSSQELRTRDRFKEACAIGILCKLGILKIVTRKKKDTTL